MAHIIQLSEFGRNLSCRMMGRKLITGFEGVIKENENLVILDFADVRFMSLSFATEIIDSLYEKFNIQNVEYVNATKLISAQVDFALKVKCTIPVA